jgi:hypothetical protein
MAQLRLALPSPIATVKRKDEGKFANQLRELALLAVLIRQFDIGKPSSDYQVHRWALLSRN